MIRTRSCGITVFQLFFLTFSYVFSGLFLIGERSFLSLLIPVGTVLLFSAVGFFLSENLPKMGAEKERFCFSRVFDIPKAVAVPLNVALILFVTAEAIVSLIGFCLSVRSFSPWIPFWLTVAVSGAVVLFVAYHGLTAIGRLSELMAFLILPLIFYLVFRNVSPVDITAFSPDLHVFFTVTPIPFLYLFPVTALRSTAMPDPGSSRILPWVSVLGAVLAVICMILFLLYGASGNHIFLLFFGWMTSVIRIAMLLCMACFFL